MPSRPSRRARPAAACVLILALLALTSCVPLSIDPDIVQDRLSAPTPLLGERAISQTFTPRYANLSAIEVMLVIYAPQSIPDDSQLVLTLDANGPAHETIQAARSLRGLRHNDAVRFEFPPQPRSRGQTYTMRFDAGDAPIALWATEGDAYADGAYQLDGNHEPGDLYFKTFYTYDLSAALISMARALMQHGLLLIATLVVLWLPGNLLRSLLPTAPRRDPLHNAAMAMGLTIAALPVLLLWSTTLGLRLSRPILLAGLGTMAVWQLVLWRRHGRRDLPQRPCGPYQIALVAILILTAATRHMQIRDLVFPPWVDSVHQALITRLIAEGGQIPASYLPFVQVDSFYRHYGFHALAAFSQWLSGFDLPQALLYIGQVLNTLTVLTAYALGSRYTRHRAGGVAAALIVGLISTMPAYYTSWGRYTQLTGMLLLPLAMLSLLELRTSRLAPILWCSLFSAGLFLTHYRVTVFFGCFALILLLHRLARHQPLKPLFISAVLSALALWPWLLRLANNLAKPAQMLPIAPGSGDAYNKVPWDLLLTGHGELLVKLAIASTAWLFLRAVFDAGQRWLATDPRPPSRLETLSAAGFRRAVQLWAWAGLVALLANLRWFGLPDIGLINNASALIAAYLPLSLLVALAIVDLVRLAQGMPYQPLQHRFPWAISTTAILLGLWGARDMVSIINPATILATADDLTAMDWIREETPHDAVFLINAQPWQRGMFMGTDGGWWIQLFTDRKMTLPPVVYQGGDPSYVAQINALANWVSRTSTLSDADALERMRRAGVTHLYLGKRQGNITPAMADASPFLEMIYADGPIRIYALRP